VTPGRIVERKVDRVRGRFAGIRGAVMGRDPSSSSPAARAHDLAGQASDRASDAGAAVSEAASTTVDTIQEAPDAARRQTRGNPLAAGLIAFGAGWLVSSLLPPSEREQQLAAQAKDVVSDVAQPVAERVGDVAREVGENLREPAQQAVQSVQETAAGAASHVADEGRQAAGQVQDRVQDAGSTVGERTASS
jgi:ElaB/YqjD/DUF883 family membrane-anchored ribosome-binding protein